MPPKPEPKDHLRSEHAEWLNTADRETRAAHPQYYWGRRPEGEDPVLYWDEMQVPEWEFRAYAGREHLEILGMVGDPIPGELPDPKRMTTAELCDKLEEYGYESVGGPLQNCIEWIELRERLGVPGRWRKS